MAFARVDSSKLEWITRPHEPGKPARRVAELSELAGFNGSRANLWLYEPGANGRRHRPAQQDETFVPVSGTLTMYLGEPPERVDVGPGGIVHVEHGTALQAANHGDEDLLVYVYGMPPESERAEILDSAL